MMLESEWARSMPRNIQHGQERPRRLVWPYAAAGGLLAVLVSIPVVVHIFAGSL